jgi:hypothetical protein
MTVAAVQDLLSAMAVLMSLLLQGAVVLLFPRRRAVRTAEAVLPPRPQYGAELGPGEMRQRWDGQ